MADYLWTGATNASFATTTNFTPNGTPVSGDTITIDGRNLIAPVWGDQHLVVLAALYIKGANTFNCGSTAAPMQIGATYCEIGAPNSDGTSASGAQQIVLDLGTGATTIHVFSTRNGGLNNQEPVMIKANNAGNTLIVDSGMVGVGTYLPGVTGSIPAITVNVGATLNVAPGFTGWTINNFGGTVNTNGAGTLLNNQSGTAFAQGTGAITTVNAGGTCTLSNRPAAGAAWTTLNVLTGGTANLMADPRTATSTNTNIYTGGKLLQASATQITHTNGIKTIECGPQDVTISAGMTVTVALS
jgi:hypothetical protein